MNLRTKHFLKLNCVRELVLTTSSAGEVGMYGWQTWNFKQGAFPSSNLFEIPCQPPYTWLDKCI